MKETTIPLLRGIAALLVLIATAFSVAVSAKTKDIVSAVGITQIRFAVDKPFDQLSPEEKKERVYHVFLNDVASKLDELYRRDVINSLISNPSIAPLTYLASLLLIASYFGEWRLKRQKAN